MRLILWLALAVLGGARPGTDVFLHGPVLDAHNGYPETGKWADRIDRAAIANGITSPNEMAPGSVG